LIQHAAADSIAAGIETLIFVTGPNTRTIEDHFDNNQELEMARQAEQADMGKNILPADINCIYGCQPEQLGLGHALLCAGSGGDIRSTVTITLHAKQCSIKTILLNVQRFDCGIVEESIAVTKQEFAARVC
jgi:UTP-glucose-1-phosphate uridylyltransferase